MKRKKDYIKIVRSCLTGNIVWVYFGSSERGARKAYWRACRHEIYRIRHWAEKMAKRRRRLMRVAGYDGDSSSIPVSKSMTPKQRAAIRELNRIIKSEPPKDTAFYDHIIAEMKRYDSRSPLWRDTHQKLIRYGNTQRASDYKKNGRPRGGDRRSAAYKAARQAQLQAKKQAEASSGEPKEKK